MTKVVNLYKKGYDVYIGRAGRGQDGYFGNPFNLKDYKNREDCINDYKKYFYNKIEKDPIFKKCILELKDKILGCFCKPQPCHGDVIAEYINTYIG